MTKTITKSLTRVGGGDKTDGDRVITTTTVELSEEEMAGIISKIADGDFYQNASPLAVWEKIKHRGTVVEYHEESTPIRARSDE